MSSARRVRPPVRGVEDLLSPHLGLADEHLRFPLGRAPHVLAHRLGRQQRLAQELLLRAELLEPEFEAVMTIVLGLVLAQQALVVLGDHAQEGLDLLPVEAREAASRSDGSGCRAGSCAWGSSCGPLARPTSRIGNFPAALEPGRGPAPRASSLRQLPGALGGGRDGLVDRSAYAAGLEPLEAGDLVPPVRSPGP